MFLNFLKTQTDKIGQVIKKRSALSEKEIIEHEIAIWKLSTSRLTQITGERYYRGEQEILKRKRTVIGPNGQLVEVNNLPNNRIVDNQYAKMVDQKANYLVGKPLTFDTDNSDYQNALQTVFDQGFQKTLQNLATDTLNCGLGWIYVYYNEEGKFCFKRFEPFEILPFWKDTEHAELDFVVRVYEVEVFENNRNRIIEKVEVYKSNGIKRFTLSNGSLISESQNSYLTYENNEGKVIEYNWGKIPIIPFKYNSKEIPLITKVKSLQDAINHTLSDFQNNMQEDARNTILILKNYDGTDLGEFRRNLATYGAVKVKTIDGANGGLEALNIEVNSENYRTVLELFKKSLIENAMGYDAKDDRLNGNPNQMNLKSMYSDIDLDANGMETEYQASFKNLMWFVDIYLGNNYRNEDLKIIFNRDMLMNETEIIESLVKSVGILSNQTLVSQHPWITDVQQELERLKDEQLPIIYSEAFKVPEAVVK